MDDTSASARRAFGRSDAFDADTSSEDRLGQGLPALSNIAIRTPSHPGDGHLTAILGGGRSTT